MSNWQSKCLSFAKSRPHNDWEWFCWYKFEKMWADVFQIYPNAIHFSPPQFCPSLSLLSFTVFCLSSSIVLSRYFVILVNSTTVWSMLKLPKIGWPSPLSYFFFGIVPSSYADFSRDARMFLWRICLHVCRFLSKQRKTSNAVGMSFLIFWSQARELRLSVCVTETDVPYTNNNWMNDREMFRQTTNWNVPTQARRTNRQMVKSAGRRSLPN